MIVFSGILLAYITFLPTEEREIERIDRCLFFSYRTESIVFFVYIICSYYYDYSRSETAVVLVLLLIVVFYIQG